jgi:carbonic anhydrase
MNIKKYLSPLLLVGLSVSSSASYALDPHWTYDEQAVWGELQNADNTVTSIPALYPFAECGLGQKQSPIEVTTLSAIAAPNNNIVPSYTPTPLAIVNNGHTIKVNIPVNVPNSAVQNFFFVGKEKYDLLQLHAHAPSEHTVNGKAFPLEIHFVHATPSGKLAVLGVLVRQGIAPNAEFQKILDNAPAVASTTVNTPANVSINPLALVPANKKFYTYAGSLTTPPCTEGVNWYVLRTSIVASKAQILAFKTLYSGNARGVQNANGRIVETLP